MRKWFPLILALVLCLMCTAAMAECEHASDFDSDSLVPNTDGTHSHVCTVCGTDNGKESCADNCYDSDTACDWCGSTYVEADNYHVNNETTCTVEGGKHVVTCACGALVGTYEPYAIYRGDKLFHVMGCSYCHGDNGESVFHTGSGTDNGDGTCSFTCADCDYTYSGAHVVAMANGDGFHGLSCYYCNAWTEKEDCYENCTDQDGECDGCGSSDLTLKHTGTTTKTIADGKCNHACDGCGEVLESYDLDWIPEEVRPSGRTGHFSECPECGKNGEGQVPHTYKYTSDADTHQAECTVCGWAEDKEAHVYADTNDLDCDVCGYALVCEHTGETVCTAKDGKHEVSCARCGEVLKTVALEWMPAEAMPGGTGGHMQICPECDYVGEKVAHQISYRQTNDTHQAECSVCEWVWDAEAHVYTDEDDNDCDVCGKTKQCQHTYWFKVPKQATCTETGTRVNYCNLCGKEHGTETIPAKGHDLSTEDKGDYILESCSRCDYENKIEKQVEAAAEEAPVTDGLQIAEADETVTLPENVTAAKAFTVAMMKDGQSVQPEEATTVTLTLTEEELTAINGLKLMLVLADGTLVEVPYEVIDGQVVFTAETLGAFAFIAE